jgi:hypothetical protein
LQDATEPFSLVLSAIALGNCTCPQDPVIPPVGGSICGAGTVNGASYNIDPASAELALVVLKPDAFTCSVFHSHVIVATAAKFGFALAGDATGTVDIEVPASGLDADEPTKRVAFLPEGEADPLSDSDRATIRGSVFGEILAVDHPTMNFQLSGLSALDGNGTASMKSTIAGTDSTTPITFTATRDGDNVNITATGVIDGTAHGMPRNALGGCVDTNLTLQVKFTMTPGAQTCSDIIGGSVFEPKFFDEPACADAPGTDYTTAYNDVIGPRCLGCHGNELHSGASSPLIDWRDWRSNSLRYPDGPLHEEALDYINVTDGLSMPPDNGSATPLALAERSGLETWFNAGAKNLACGAAVEKKTFGENDGKRVEPGVAVSGEMGCDNVTYTLGVVSAEDFFGGNCRYCHETGQQSVSVDTPVVFIDGVGQFSQLSTHPFYADKEGAQLTFFEAGLHRVRDASMPPVFPATDADQIAAYEKWVRCGMKP